MLFSKKKIENKKHNEKFLTEFQDTNNPFLHAKWEWNERYGSFIKEKEKWQKISFFILIALIISIIGLVSVSLQSKITAFFVKTDQLGKPIVIERVDPTTKLNSSVVAYQLGEFITYVRTVTTDGKLKKYWLQVAQKYCSQTASNFLQEYLDNNPPEKLAQVMNISVSIISVMPIKSTESWQINWKESASKNGLSVGETTWSAIVNIGIIPIKNEEDFIKNPTGLIIKSINWTRTK